MSGPRTNKPVLDDTPKFRFSSSGRGPGGAEGHKFVQRFRSFIRVPALKNYMSLSRLSAFHRGWDPKGLLNYINHVTSVVREWVAMGGKDTS